MDSRKTTNRVLLVAWAAAFVAAGIHDELLSNLSKIKDLKVISRTSVMEYKAGITRSLKEIAQQLGVSNVVEGSVRRSGNHVRVSAQLIDAQTDAARVGERTYLCGFLSKLRPSKGPLKLR